MAHRSIRRFDGGWGYRVDLGPGPSTGKRRQTSKQGFRTKRQAELAMQEIIGAARDGVVPNRSGRALGDFLDEWLECGRTGCVPRRCTAIRLSSSGSRPAWGTLKIPSSHAATN